MRMSILIITARLFTTRTKHISGTNGQRGSSISTVERGEEQPEDNHNEHQEAFARFEQAVAISEEAVGARGTGRETGNFISSTCECSAKASFQPCELHTVAVG